MLQRVARVAIALLFSSPAFAQFSINGTELVTSAPAVVDAGQDVGTNTGADIDLENEFGVGITVEFRNAAGDLISSVGLLKNSILTVEHDLPAGTYNIFVYEAGQPSTSQDCGDLVVL